MKKQIEIMARSAELGELKLTLGEEAIAAIREASDGPSPYDAKRSEASKRGAATRRKEAMVGFSPTWLNGECALRMKSLILSKGAIDAAKLIGISPSVLNNIIRGARPTDKMATKIRGFLLTWHPGYE